MAALSNGTYFVFNAASSRCLDVSANGLTDGTNIQIYDYNQTDAQVWLVQDAYNNTKHIINRLSGKNLDVADGSTTPGTNVQIYANTDPYWLGQRLVIQETSATATISGTTYECYYISMASDLDAVFSAASTSNYANVQIADKTTDTKQYWCFVPVPAFRNEGIYEIASALNYELRLDVACAGKTDGTNLQLFAANGGNVQKFEIKQETVGYSLKSVLSGKYVDVAGNIAEENRNVQMWGPTTAGGQRWNLVSYGTTTIDGETVNCYRLGSYVTNDGATYFMNVANAVGTSKANVQIHTVTSTPNDCLFALIPSYACDPTIPIPYDLGCCSDLMATDRRDWAEQNTDFYLTWKCPDSWVSSGPNHYEIRTRARSMSSVNSTWNSWTSWTPWCTAGTTQDDNQSWLLTAFNHTYLWTQKKNYQLQFQVRGVGVDETTNEQRIGQPATQTINVYRTPGVLWANAGWTPEGIRLGWTSDYKYGSTEFWLKSLGTRRASETTITTNILTKPRTIKGNSFKASELIPYDALTKWPGDGDYLYLSYDLGYDQAYPYKAFDRQIVILADAGTTPVTPIFDWSGVILVAFAPDLGTTKMWVRADDKLYECEETNVLAAPSGTKAFEVVYPMGKAFQVYTSSTNSSGSLWGTDVTDMEAINKFFHAFTWEEDGKTRRVYLEAFGDAASFQVQKSAVYQADVLDARENESVSSADTVKTRLNISGVLLEDGQTTSNSEDIRYMVNHHVRWRSPMHGNFADLYISDITLTESHNRTEVSITAIKETI